MIPQGKIEAAARAINPRAFMEPMNNQLRNDQRRALVDANKALEAAAAWDREHAAELVTDAVVLRALDEALKFAAFRYALADEQFDARDLMRSVIEAALREMGK